MKQRPDNRLFDWAGPRHVRLRPGRHFWCLPALCAAGRILAAQTGESTLLEPGQAIERQLAGGQSHEYQFVLQAGQYAKVLVEQRSINVAVACFAPDGKPVFEADNYLAGEAESAELIGEASGSYRFRVRATDPTAPSGRYAITLWDVQAATERHKSRVAAARAFARASTFPERTRETLLKIVATFEDALAHWRAAQDLFEQARTLYSIGSIYAELGDQPKALEYSTQALPVARASHDQRFEAWALRNMAEFHNNFGDKRKAIEYFDQAMPLMRAAGDRAGEGSILNGLGTAYARTGEKRKALACFEQAVQVLGEFQDRNRLASITSNIGVTYSDLGDYPRALENHQRALALQREGANRGGQAITLNNIGTAWSSLAEYQKALDAYTAALEINRSLDGRWHIAINLHNIAWVYANLGDRGRALNFYQEALEILRAVKDQWGMGHTLNNIAELYAELGDYRKSLTVHNEGLALRRTVGDPDGEATSLNNMGTTYGKLGERDKARDHFERALAIARTTGERRRLAGILSNLGAFHREAGDGQRALDYLDEALQVNRAIQDRRGEATTLAELARVERYRGNLGKAHEWAAAALASLESLRRAVASPTLRASFFASARANQELDIEVLMRLHQQRPEKGFGAAALYVSERGRARSLLELLGESGAEIRRGIDPALIDRERKVERLISGKAELQVRLLSGKHTDANAAAARKELDALTAELEQVQGRIRQTSPQYAALTQPEPLNLREIQTDVLDEDTILLEYALGADKSFLWAVTSSAADIFELPPRAEIESAAKRVYDHVTARNQKPAKETPVARAARLRQADAAYFTAAAKVSRMLLGPVASRIEDKRLLFVGEGVLQYLPFAALPEPGTDAGDDRKQPPLIVKHEIVIAPSASVVAVLRRETAGRKRAEGALAVLADPVFSADDARVVQYKKGVLTAAIKDNAEGEATRSAAGPGVPEFARLRFSRREAEEIARLAPAAATLKALDFDASRDTVLSPDFGRHRIVHFATHSLLNNQRPELSGVVLSLVDRSGHPQNGFLRLYDIYNLRLASDLVVLSACQTALGGEIKGEGLIGLTRGFLYAGAARVVASLWEIDDRTSAELMKRFYEGMLVRGERPAAALRAAQADMWRTRGWDAPYYWAAYTLQGEWR